MILWFVYIGRSLFASQILSHWPLKWTFTVPQTTQSPTFNNLRISSRALSPTVLQRLPYHRYYEMLFDLLLIISLAEPNCARLNLPLLLISTAMPINSGLRSDFLINDIRLSRYDRCIRSSEWPE